MFGLIKKLFGGSKEPPKEEEPPGRTFKRILTGDYFGLRNEQASETEIYEAKRKKIDQIEALGLKPKFLRYAMQKSIETGEETIRAAHVVFQKEEFDEKLHMVHVTEISFIVFKEEFEEFESMAGVSLQKDFRNIYEAESKYEGKERRRKPRPSPLDELLK